MQSAVPIMRNSWIDSPRRATRLSLMKTAVPTDKLQQLLDELDRCLSTVESDDVTALGVAEVRAGIAEYRSGHSQQKSSVDNPLAARWLPPCLELLAQDVPRLAQCLSAASPSLNWVTYDGYDENKIGAGFARQHAYASLIGDDSLLFAPDYDLGLFLIAPHVLYRDHCHAAPELYLPLTGPHGWRFEPDAALKMKQAFEPIWNEPGQSHLTKVGPKPFLSLYCWTRDNDKPAAVVPASDWAALESLRLIDEGD